MKKFNKIRKTAITASAVVAFIMGAGSVSANTLGIDVSSHQNSTIQYFNSFKQVGNKFAIVKVGGRGGGEGAHYVNPKASAQLINANAVGMQTASYFWGEFGDSVPEAKYHAQLAIQDSLNAGLLKGSYIALDYEAGAGINKANNTTAILTFMDEIYAAGFKPMLYSGAYYMKQHIDVSRINARYPNALWVAAYPTTSHQANPNMAYFPSMSNVKIWQYADNHFGVDGNVMVVGSLDNNTPVEDVAKPTNRPTDEQPASTANKTQYATFNGVYVTDYWTKWQDRFYGVNKDMGIPVIDYNNYIPISALTMTDKYGHKLRNQNIQGNNGRMEYFTLDGKYKVLSQTATAVQVEIAGEPVWMMKSFATIK